MASVRRDNHATPDVILTLGSGQTTDDLVTRVVGYGTVFLFFSQYLNGGLMVNM